MATFHLNDSDKDTISAIVGKVAISSGINPLTPSELIFTQKEGILKFKVAGSSPETEEISEEIIPIDTIAEPSIEQAPVASAEQSPEITSQAKVDLEEFYNKIASEDDFTDRTAFMKEILMFAWKYKAYIIPAIKTLWKAFKYYTGDKSSEEETAEENVPMSAEASEESIKKAALDLASLPQKIDNFISFITDLLSNEATSDVLNKALKTLFGDKAETIRSGIDEALKVAQEVIEVLSKFKESISEKETPTEGEGIESPEVSKLSGEIVQVNSDTFVIHKGSEFYKQIESSALEISEIKKINDVIAVEIEISPEMAEYCFRKSDSSEIKIKEAAFEDFLGSKGITGFLNNPIAQLARENPTVAGASNVGLSFLQSKMNGTPWSLWDNGVLPFLEGRLGGVYTMAGGRLAQQMGWSGWKYMAAVGVGFLLDSMARSAAESDTEKKQALTEEQQKLQKSLGMTDPQMFRQVMTYAQQRKISFGEALKEISAAYKETGALS
ncbi:MAG TPA: hypothetical protein P5136_00300 [Methanofastidiosum sp.]|nr:hypothetical protein [Methanofastidiosum sp.]